jgi:hypothetical protein
MHFSASVVRSFGFTLKLVSFLKWIGPQWDERQLHELVGHNGDPNLLWSLRSIGTEFQSRGDRALGIARSWSQLPVPLGCPARRRCHEVLDSKRDQILPNLDSSRSTTLRKAVLTGLCKSRDEILSLNLTIFSGWQFDLPGTSCRSAGHPREERGTSRPSAPQSRRTDLQIASAEGVRSSGPFLKRSAVLSQRYHLCCS